MGRRRMGRKGCAAAGFVRSGSVWGRTEGLPCKAQSSAGFSQPLTPTPAAVKLSPSLVNRRLPLPCEQTNIITAVFMEKCSSTEAERA